MVFTQLRFLSQSQVSRRDLSLSQYRVRQISLVQGSLSFMLPPTALYTHPLLPFNTEIPIPQSQNVLFFLRPLPTTSTNMLVYLHNCGNLTCEFYQSYDLDIIHLK